MNTLIVHMKEVKCFASYHPIAVEARRFISLPHNICVHILCTIS